jgi:hypothetical protein
LLQRGTADLAPRERAGSRRERKTSITTAYRAPTVRHRVRSGFDLHAPSGAKGKNT